MDANALGPARARLNAMLAAGQMLTWIDGLRFVCDGCGAVCRAAREAIDAEREDGGDDWDDTTDAEVVNTWCVCLSCAEEIGQPLPGERVARNAAAETRSATFGAAAAKSLAALDRLNRATSTLPRLVPVSFTDESVVMGTTLELAPDEDAVAAGLEWARSRTVGTLRSVRVNGKEVAL